MKYILFIFSVTSILLLSSCTKKKSSEVERITVIPQILSNEVYSSLPGSILVYDNELVWINHSSTEDFIHILDKKTGEEKITFGNIGGGPEEFFTPSISYLNNRQLIIYDLNSPKILSFSLDSLSTKNIKSKKINLAENTFTKISLLGIEDNKYILFGLEDSKPFLFIDKNKATLFGDFPIKDSTNIMNKYDVFQGPVLYNHWNKKLLYSVGEMSYIALYEYNKDSFEKKWEKTLSEVQYTISGNTLTVNETPVYAPTGLTLSKDYIVSIERDEKYATPLPKRTFGGRDFSRLPHTLFIYDYEMNLEKIVNVGFPIIRINSDGATNEIYFIGANPELCIGKLTL